MKLNSMFCLWVFQHISILEYIRPTRDSDITAAKITDHILYFFLKLTLLNDFKEQFQSTKLRVMKKN